MTKNGNSPWNKVYIVWFCSKPDSTDTSLSSMATLHRFEYQADRHTMIHLHDVLIQPFIDSFKTPPKKLILDFDATDNPIHGDQVGKYFNRYYDHHCFYPCMCFVVIDC